MERRIWFLLHLFFLSSGGFAFRHLTGSLRKGIRSICGFPTGLYVWSFPRRCFMNIWIYLTDICPKDVFPLTNFPVREWSSCTRRPRLYTTNRVFFAFYSRENTHYSICIWLWLFQNEIYFYPQRPRGYICAVAMHDRAMFTEIIFIIINESRPLFLFLFV